MGQEFALSPHRNKGSNLGRFLTLKGLHVLPMCAWVFSRRSSFHPQAKNIQVRLFGSLKLPLGVNMSLSLCLDWRPVQGVFLLRVPQRCRLMDIDDEWKHVLDFVFQSFGFLPVTCIERKSKRERERE